MMNVFLWQSYGSDLIFETTDDVDISHLIDRIEAATRGWNIEREIDHLRKTLAERPIAVRAEITKFFNRHSYDTAFEHGHFHNTEELS